MKNKLIVITIFVITLISCQSSNNQKSKNISSNKEKSSVEKSLVQSDKNKLLIEGNNIWIRSKPFTGKVVMKLNEGDVCTVLDKTDKVQVKNMLDHWYKIKFHGQTGWVFGAQTNKKKSETIKIEPFNKFINRFLPKYNKRSFNEFIHKDIPSQVVYNTGGVRTPNTIEKRPPSTTQFMPNYEFPRTYNRMPKGHYCDGFEGVKDGLYYWKAKYIANHNNYKFDDVPNDRVEGVPTPEKYQLNQFYRAILIKDEFQFAYLYFINIGNTWYLVTEDYLDCSA